jgi:hypothetical protein
MLDGFRPQDKFKLLRCVGFVCEYQWLHSLGELGEFVTLLPN